MEFSLRCSFKHLFLYVPLSAVPVIICELVTIGIYDAQIRFCFCKLSCWGQAGGKTGARRGQVRGKSGARAGQVRGTHGASQGHTWGTRGASCEEALQKGMPYYSHMPTVPCACTYWVRGSSPKIERKGIKRLVTSSKIDKQRIKERGSWSDSMSVLHVL